MDDDALVAFVEQFRLLARMADERLPPPGQRPSALVDRLTEHFGFAAPELPVVPRPFDLPTATFRWR